MASYGNVGSQVKTDSTTLPNAFFSQMLPKITEMAELKVVLYVSYLIQRRQGHPPFVTYEELLSQKLITAMDEGVIRKALDSAVEDRVLVHSTIKITEESKDVYFGNTESDKERFADFKSGRSSPGATMPEDGEPGRNIFTLYEQNIGIITPIIAEELKEAERLYPSRWIAEAFKEAVTMNKRRWKYIARILESWASEGKDSGEHRRGLKKGDPDKYVKGKYGHLVKR
jgi:DNA replication protein